MPKFQKPYGERVKPKTETGDESPVQQHFKDEVDINNIMAKYIRTGIIDHVAAHGMHYGDFEDLNYHEVMNRITAANQMFMDLPAKIRQRFNNDAGEFINFITNPDNLAEARELGLAEPEGADPNNTGFGRSNAVATEDPGASAQAGTAPAENPDSTT
jgi:phage internal scaffolding protein